MALSLRKISQPARDLARTVLLLTGRPAAPDSSLMVIAPHPDDETLGCAARILRARRAGSTVTVVVATSELDVGAQAGQSVGEVRSGEFHAAMDQLGVPVGDRIELGLPDGRLLEHVEALAIRLLDLLRERRPGTVLVTCVNDLHDDHRAAALAARQAIAACGHAVRLREYPVWLWSDWPVSRHHGRHGLVDFARVLCHRTVELTWLGADGARKRQALACYASQLGSGGLPRPVLRRAGWQAEIVFVIDQQ